jgi:ATP-binding cassette subfamily C (CFTR/MRP) protein 1
MHFFDLTEHDLLYRLCIAHRLATIAFYDRVLVLDKGTIVEFDTPLSLYDQESSIFRSMCDAAQLDKEAILKIRNEGAVGVKAD